MTTPAAPEDVKLFEVPDVAGRLQRDWPRLVSRASVALLLPVLVTYLAKTLGFYGPVAQLALPLDFLHQGPFAYEAKTIALVVFLLVMGAFLWTKRTHALVLAICGGAILWVGFLYTRLHWSRLVLPDFDPLRKDAPPVAAWLLGGSILLVGIAFLLAEALLDARDAQKKRGLPDDETQALARVAARTGGIVLVGGVLAAVAIGFFYAALRQVVRAPGFHADAVLAFFLLGVGLSLALVVALKPRGAPLFAPPPAPPAVTVPVQATPSVAQGLVEPARPAKAKKWNRGHALAATLSGATVASVIAPWQAYVGPFATDSTPGFFLPQGMIAGLTAFTAIPVYLVSGPGRARTLAPVILLGISFAMVLFAGGIILSLGGFIRPHVGLVFALLVSGGALGAALWGNRLAKTPTPPS